MDLNGKGVVCDGNMREKEGDAIVFEINLKIQANLSLETKYIKIGWIELNLGKDTETPPS